MEHALRRQVELKAPPARVWRALAEELAATSPVVTRSEPARHLVFTWREGTPTFVELRLEDTPEGTLLTLEETGFENIPIGRRGEEFKLSDERWAERMRRLEARVA
jgi:uncharacterized protein YndB with AHSA1/START domain